MLLPTHEQTIVSDYLQLQNRKTIQERYNLSNYKFYSIMNRHGVTLRNLRANSQYSKEAFVDFDNDPLAAYFYGLILSDGNLYKGKIQLNCQASDLVILQHLKDYINSPAKIHYRASTNSYLLAFADQLLVERLIAQGLEPAKSNKERLPNFNWQKSPDFIRGLLDGDGCISLSTSGSPSVDLCGSAEIVDGFICFVEKHIQTKKHKVKRHVHASGLCRVGYYGSEAMELLNIVYYDQCMSIPRKTIAVQELRERKNGIH